MTSRLEARRIFIVCCIAVLVFTPLMWMVSDRDLPYSIERVTIEPSEPVADGNIAITFHIKRGLGRCGAGAVYREFLHVKTRRLFVYDPITRAVPPDITEGQFTRVATLPNGLHGEAMYRGVACYPCNSLQRLFNWPVCVHTPEVFFNVK